MRILADAMQAGEVIARSTRGESAILRNRRGKPATAMPPLGALTAAAIALAAIAADARVGQDRPARTPDIHYTPTRHQVAEAMLRLAQVRRDDVVYDLGAGDGRLVIIAAQQYGARGVGIEIDPRLVATSRQNARDAGVEDRVSFVVGDLFTADISPATVVTLYLSTAVNKRLEPKLRRELKPGTRIVSHQFLIGTWPPEETIRPDFSDVYLWRIPQAGDRVAARPGSPS
jgi:SAM-dependent methyltransferase